MRLRIALLGVAACALLGVSSASAAKPKTIPRPTYKGHVFTVQSPYLVVHYVKTGIDRPRFMKDDDHNGVPNYVQKLAAAANRAWLYYGHAGFKAPLRDTGGGNAKLDVYVKALPKAFQGVSIPPLHGQGGGFIVLNNDLDMAHVAKNGSLQQTIAHELFHEFQFSYLPNGTALPKWISEGSATAMSTFVYPQITDPTVVEYVDHWLNQPWRSLADERNACDHCYGGVLWWRFLYLLGHHTLPTYLGRLYGYQHIGKPIGTGLQPLTEVLQKVDHQTLFDAFSRFTYDLYRGGARPSSRLRLHATPVLHTTRVHKLVGLSTDYVPVTVSPQSKSIAIGVAADGGPYPNVKLVIGGPKGRTVPRVMQDHGHVQFLATAFRNASEKRKVMLIIASGRRHGTLYKLTFQAPKTSA